MEANLLSSVRTARQFGVETFASIAERLSETRGAAEALADQLAAIGEQTRSDGTRGADLLRLAAQLKDEIEAWRPGGDDAEGPVAEAIRALASVETQSHQLLSIASLTEITASAMHAQMMLSYVADLRAVAQALGEGATAVSQTLAKLQKSAASRLTDITDIADALDPILAQLRDQAPTGGDELAAVGGASERAAAEAERRARENVRRLIEGMQFSDAFSQRLEHVEAMLQDPAGGALEALAAAQLAATADEGAALAVGLTAVLEDLERVAQSVESFAQDGGGARAAAAVSEQRDELLAAVAAYEALAPRLLQADQSAEELAADVGATGAVLQKLVARVEEIQLAAVNAELFSSRLGGARGPLSVLASAVRDTVTGSTDSIAGARTVLDRLHQQFGVDAQAPMTAAMRALDQEIAAIRRSVSHHDQSLRELAEIKNRVREAAVRMTANTGASRAQIGRIGDLMRELEALASSASGAGAPDEDALDRAWALYTMAAEREVHLARHPRADDAAAEPVDDIELF